MNDDIVRLVMERQFPSLELHAVEPLGSGWEYDVYLIDGHLAVRFPRYADVSRDLDRAEARLQFVAGEIGSAVTVPRIILRGEPGPHFPHRFFGHEWIPGIPAAELVGHLPERLASDLGIALTHIHGISPERASVVKAGAQKWSCRSSFDGLVDVLEEVPEVSRLVPEGAAWVGRVSAVPQEYAGPARFIHDDFQPEHIIVDGDSGGLRGVIDWGGSLGDPAQDFSFIAAWAGWEFTTSVLSAYQGVMDGDFLDRLLFLGRVRALGWLAYGIHVGLDTREQAEVARDLLSRNDPS